jgi:hypothetical protein
MPDPKKIEKEIQGLKAKLKWDHLADGVRKTYEERLAELERKLTGEG